MAVPKLRFSQFHDEWSAAHLDEIANIYDGTHQTPKYTDFGIPFVSVENINDIYHTNKYISEDDFNKYYKVKPRRYDILMTRIGVIGETALITRNTPIAYYVSLALIRCHNIFPNYLEKYIHSRAFRKELNKRIIHTAFPKKINLGDIGKCKVYTTTLAEQQKIADFLSTIDIIISSQKEELAAWEQRKKGVIQKLFSQEVRFKADDGSEFPEWEEKRLGDFTKKVDRKAEEKSMADIRMISQGNGFILQSEKYSRDNTGESLKRYTLLYKGEFAYNHGASKQKPFGICYCLTECEEARVPFVYHTFKIVEGCTDYFNYALNLPSIDRQLKRMVSSGARMDGLLNIRYDSYMSIKINIPSLPEQQKIADCLSSIDEVIKKEKEELEKWQELKKGLLQQMFV